MNQRRMLLKIKRIHRSSEQSKPVPVRLLSALLFLVVQLNAVAQELATEVDVQIAQSVTTVKCDAGEHYLAIVKASMPTAGVDAHVSAFGFALVPTNGDVKMFARYWFWFNHELVGKRDDDSGALEQSLVSDGGPWEPRVNKFFENCTLDKEKMVVAEVLGNATSQSSVNDAILALTATGLQFKAVTTSKQNLAKPLTDQPEDYVSISKLMRTVLRQQTSDTTPNPIQQEPAPGPVRDTNQLEAIEKNLKQMEQKIDTLSSRQRTFLTLLTAALLVSALLIAGLILLFYFKPAFRRGILSDPEVAKEITQRTIQELQKFDALNRKEDHGTGPGDNAETVAIREFISDHFGRKFLDQDVQKGLSNLTDELNKNLSPLATDSNGSSATLDRLRSARKHVDEMWKKYSSEPCPSGALTTLQNEWATLQNTFQPFKQDGFEGVLVYARESVALFQYLSEKFEQQNQKPEELKQEVEEFFKALDRIYNDFTPPHLRTSLPPRSRLVDLEHQLISHKKINQSATDNIKTALPDASGTIDQLALTLVNEFNSDRELVSQAKEFKDSAEQLQRQLDTSQINAEKSTQLAGALSRYVHLSTDMQLDSSQVQVILQRFTAGDNTHRQLRLRLSAGLEALDRAVAAVSNAGRDDALAALRIDDFKDRLHNILPNIEDFPGDAIWKKCISSGFSQRWLHDLLRAELLARTYFEHDDSLELLVHSLTEASTALRATIREFKVRVPFLTLLGEPPRDARRCYEVNPKLRDLTEFQQKVRAMWEQRKPGEDPKFIVDVELFPWQSDSKGDVGEVVVISGSEM